MLIIRLLATCGHLGNVRYAPGTVASAAASLLGWFILSGFGFQALLIGSLLASVLGILISEIYVRKFSEFSDPGEVVIDELAGQWLCFITAQALIFYATNASADLAEISAILSQQPLFWLVGFGFFRLFDIVKPWPISWADRRVKGGLGIMLDDILAGIIAGIFLFITISVAPILWQSAGELP
jgi:phosphatidylglycerophosphatase A